jgi:hypothetical protein
VEEVSTGGAIEEIADLVDIRLKQFESLNGTNKRPGTNRTR